MNKQAFSVTNRQRESRVSVQSKVNLSTVAALEGAPSSWWRSTKELAYAVDRAASSAPCVKGRLGRGLDDNVTHRSTIGSCEKNKKHVRRREKT